MIRSSLALRRCSLLLLLTASVGGYLGCAGRPGLFRAFRDVKPKTVGVVLPLTGSYQRVGEALLEGIRLGVQGSAIKLEVKDSKSDPAEAERAVEALASEGVIALLGGVAPTEAEAVSRRADAIGIPVINFSKSDEATAPGSYVFRNMVTLQEQAEATARFASCELGLKRFGWLGPDADYARELQEGFKRGLAKGAQGIVQEERYPAGQTTFTGEAKRLTGRADPASRPDYQIKEKEILAKEQDPFRRRKALEKLRASLPPVLDYEGLFIADGWQAVSLIAPALAVEDLVTEGCDRSALERVRKLLGKDELHPVTLLGWGGWSSPISADGTPELLVRAGRHLQCGVYADAFFAGSERKASRRFVSAFRAEKGGQTPQLLNALGYDAAGMVRSIIEDEAPGDSDRMQSLLSRLKGFEGATGTLSFDQSRSAKRQLLMLKVTPQGLEEQPSRQTCRTPSH
jgi:branched-chain amino acid transport system substrate-binding protein